MYLYTARISIRFMAVNNSFWWGEIGRQPNNNNKNNFTNKIPRKTNLIYNICSSTFHTNLNLTGKN